MPLTPLIEILRKEYPSLQFTPGYSGCRTFGLKISGSLKDLRRVYPHVKGIVEREGFGNAVNVILHRSTRPKKWQIQIGGSHEDIRYATHMRNPRFRTSRIR